MCSPLKILDKYSTSTKLLQAKNKISQLQRLLYKSKSNNKKANEKIKKLVKAFNKMSEQKRESDNKVMELKEIIAKIEFNAKIINRTNINHKDKLKKQVVHLEYIVDKLTSDTKLIKNKTVLPPIPHTQKNKKLYIFNLNK